MGAVELGDGLFSTGAANATARGAAHLLSMFDEYVSAYADRSVLSDTSDFVLGARTQVLVDGAVASRWRLVRTARKTGQSILELMAGRPQPHSGGACTGRNEGPAIVSGAY